MTARLLRDLLGALQPASDLVLTRCCAGCERTGTRWCTSCDGALAGEPLRRRLADGTTVWSGTGYDGVVREAVNAWKDRDRADLTPVLARAAARAHVSGGLGAASLVPVPSTGASRRRRGWTPVSDLAREVARQVGEAHVLPLLRHCRRVADQSGLDVRARAENLAGALEVPLAVRERAAGRCVVLVDDVVTSGATLVEAARAVRAAGAVVAGAVTVAATPREHAGQPVARPVG